MGSTRKLQGEIDRVLKKVQEGVDVFDSIWNKVYDTENANQKEKFEADLKKEIKKLQRYRDQIKTWIQSSEIKEKKALLDARKQIEREMERFKVCEKETKTKAFSKEGLGQQPKTDPREKAKGESRDWLNNMVSDLESQVDNFEAEMEGLTVKKGKTRPPRLTHLEDSISRHKQHITKLELILRLLENDGLSPEEVNDVKDYVEDYVERNQDDFDEFMNVEDLYQLLPLDKLEALEALEAIPVVAPAIVVKEKVAVAAASGAPAPNGTGVKSPIAPGPVQAVAAAAATAAAVAVIQQGSPSSLLLEEVTNQEAGGKSGVRTSYMQTGNVSSPTSAVVSNVDSTGTGTPSAAGTSLLTHGLGAVAAPGSLTPGTASGKGLARTASPTLQSSPISLSKEAETGNLGRRVVTTSVGDASPARGAVGGSTTTEQSPPGMGGFPSTTGIVGSDDIIGTPPRAVPELRKTGLAGDDRLGGGGLAQQLATPIGAQDKVFVQPGGQVESGGISDGVTVSEGGIIGSRMFSPSVGGQWRLATSSTFQNQSEPYHGRTEIAPDQKQKYLQRLQEHQHQQGQSAALLSAAAAQLSHLASPTQKPQALASGQQQLQLQNFQQHEQPQSSLSQPSRTSVLQQQQTSLGLGLQSQHMPSSQGQQQQLVQQFTRSQSSQQLRPGHLSESGSSKDLSDPTVGRAGEQQQFQSPQLRSMDEDSTDISSLTASFHRSASLTEDDSKNADTFDVVVGDPGTLAELSQLSREVDFPPGPGIRAEQPLKGPGVIGMRSVTDSGGPRTDIPGIPSINTATHDQMYNRQALDAAYTDIPLPKDSERPKSYIPRYPAATPASYPQVPAVIMENPALWERLETDVLFLAFYYQQGTLQQYLAARELKKQSWRYHKKYNTWFQRHEEPKIATDEYEQGTYVYFDFHIVPDDFQQGWCQRIKSEFTFEYSYLEDELVL